MKLAGLLLMVWNICYSEIINKALSVYKSGVNIHLNGKAVEEFVSYMHD